MPAPPRCAAVCLLTGVALTLAACGRANREEQVRQTLDRFTQAMAAKDYQALCDDLFSAQLVAKVNQAIPCEVALRRSDIETLRSPSLRVLSVEVKGDRASARVRTSAANQPPSEDTVGLIREKGDWRVLSLNSP